VRYLKLFNESQYQTDLQELEDFCNSHLSYLIDEGYHLRIQETHFEQQNEDAFQVVLVPPITIKRSFFSGEKKIGTPFVNFKDRLIPFVHMLLKDYRLIGNELISRVGLEPSGSIGFFVEKNLKSPKAGDNIIRLGSLEDLENFEDEHVIDSFYIRIQKKD
jgi:hypothetical protein